MDTKGIIQQTVTYEYYNEYFPNLSEDEFNSVYHKAERYVLKRINMDLAQSPSDYDDIMDCICDIINYLYARKQSRGLKGVSNDGYSVTYATQSEVDNVEEIYSILQEWCSHLIVEYWGF